MAVPVYQGRFGKPQAERLLSRAGFGPRPGEAEKFAKLGLDGAVHKLTHPGRERLRGPKPHDDNGHPLAPFDAYGHAQLWWLDRMVRTSRPLAERMTLIWPLAAAATVLATGPASATTTLGRLGVRATEFHLTLSRASVKTGRVLVQLQNAGEDVHDLRLRRIGGTRTYMFR